MPDILKPNAKALVWLAIGAFLVPKIMASVGARLG